ncbi:MAG: tripartite tricarboxylate transporter permease [Hyphomicrobiales bacterium]|nr:tripartite tricarboxylate transporter permease [Hyphomicrobiales bacterium]
MIDVDALQQAFYVLFTDISPWIAVPAGLMIGLMFGMLPGLSVPIAMAVFLPLTLYMDFTTAILFLTAIFTGGGFGGAVPAVLMNVPGTSAALATTFDGYPMARKGRHNEALGLALGASTVATALGYLLLLLLIEPASRVVLKLGPPELFMVALWGLTLIAALSEGSFFKGLLAGALGLLAGTIGMSSAGVMRGTFGSMHMLDGIPITAALIGLIAASELFDLVKSDYIVEDERSRKVSLREILRGFFGALRNFGLILRGSFLGSVIGAVPGIGSTVANLVSYSYTKNRARGGEKDTFGKGNPKGVVAAESANSSSEAGSMVTLLALGVPGGAGTAVMLGAFAMHNVTGGPRFISDNKEIVYTIILGNFVQSVLLVFIGIFFLRISILVVKLPLRFLVPSIMALTILGAYALTGNMLGPITLVGAAILGWIMKLYGYPAVAMVIGLLLGAMAEGELLRSYQLGGRDLTIFFERPIALTLLALLLLTLAYPMIRRLRARSRIDRANVST